MEIRKFEMKDLAEINKWYEASDQQPMCEYSVPPNGFMVDGLAAIFVYLTDGGFGIVEGLIANPEANRMSAALAIRKLVMRAYEVCESAKKVALVITKNKGVASLSKRLGYKTMGAYQLLSRG